LETLCLSEEAKEAKRQEKNKKERERRERKPRRTLIRKAIRIILSTSQQRKNAKIKEVAWVVRTGDRDL
jgi:hypothetical protein